MGERKVLNKYYPPDFDPTLLPRNRKPHSSSSVLVVQARLYSAPTPSMQTTCWNMEPPVSEMVCQRHVLMLPGNYEVWNDRRGEEEEEEDNDVMKALEKKTHDNKVKMRCDEGDSIESFFFSSQNEMDILDALDDYKTLNARSLIEVLVVSLILRRHQKIDMDKVLDKLRREQEEHGEHVRDKIELDDQEEELVEQTEFENNVRRISEDEEKAREREREGVKAAAKAAMSGGVQAQPKRLAGVMVKRKAEEAPQGEVSSKEKKIELAGLMGDYSSSNSD
eukprot:768513-Hanusia_phi.AAC.3